VVAGMASMTSVAAIQIVTMKDCSKCNGNTSMDDLLHLHHLDVKL
jgi:hypothetical protein